MSDTPKRRWFRWIIVTASLVAMLCLAYCQSWTRERQAFIARENVFGFASIAGGYPRTPAPWHLRILGAPGYGSISIVMSTEDPALVRYAERLFPEAYVSHVPAQGEGRYNFDAVLEGYIAQGNLPVE